MQKLDADMSWPKDGSSVMAGKDLRPECMVTNQGAAH